MAVTIMDHIGSSGGDGMRHLKNGISYILNPLKTGDGKFTGTVNCYSNAPEKAYDDFLKTKKIFGKMMEHKTDRQGYHFVLSFSPEDRVKEETAMVIAESFIKKYLGERFEAVYAVHNDRAHIHAHIIFNSVSVEDGMKYHDNKGDWEHILQPIVNEICEQYGLQTIDLDMRSKERSEGIYRKQNMEAALARLDFAEIINNGTQCKVRTIIPEYHLEYGTRLKDNLKALGVNLMFSRNADFSRMMKDVDFKLSDIIHKARIEVDRNGTRASAVTMGGMFLSKPPEPVKKVVCLNRPFVYAVVNNKSGVPLFVGTVGKL